MKIDFVKKVTYFKCKENTLQIKENHMLIYIEK